MENPSRQAQAQSNSMLSSYDERQQFVAQLFKNRVERYNAEDGMLTGYDCPKCRNRGDFMVYDEKHNTTYICPCTCMEVRRKLARLSASGLEDQLKYLTFENYSVDEPWQQHIKQSALEFTQDYSSKWFYIGGQVGCGKTHICTAIVGEFLKRGEAARYMLWRDETVRIKQVINNEEEYSRIVDDLKTVKVLYIDDFLKGRKGEKPSDADIKLAFEILNYRYIQRELVTILSSEYDIMQIIDIDQAVGSRIYERAKKYYLKIKEDTAKNQRLKDEPLKPKTKEASYWWQQENL